MDAEQSQCSPNFDPGEGGRQFKDPVDCCSQHYWCCDAGRPIPRIGLLHMQVSSVT